MNDSRHLSIHDNHLISYEVFCERREIRFHTEYRDQGEPFERIDVIFTGVVAYDFCHDSKMGTIIFDITKCPATEIYAENTKPFTAGLPFGWPGDWAKTPEAAAVYFRKNEISGFWLHSSCGMNGWVLAHQMTKVKVGTPA